mmetsp:Transcript_9664/g.17380  ORF Transcript_9664/g.17380 Transcript_9664/m.17380 type:complete len:281 (+) Transcript_9664:46-888(+)
MGNILSECNRCNVVDQCQLCTELTRSPEDGAATGRRQQDAAAGGRHQDYQPGDVSEEELIQQALRLSQLEAQQRSGGPVAAGSLLAGGDERPRAASNPEDEDAAVAEALQQEDAVQRAQLLEEQEAEYQESLQIDRARAAEEALRKKEEEERLRQEAEELESAKLAAEAAEKQRQEKVAKVLEEAQQLLPAEPPEGEPGRLQVLIRTPDGKRLKRAFRSEDTVGQVYAYANVEGGEALASREFMLVTAIPRCTYEDRSATLADAGLKGQCALLVEMLDDE